MYIFELITIKLFHIFVIITLMHFLLLYPKNDADARRIFAENSSLCHISLSLYIYIYIYIYMYIYIYIL